MGTYIVPLALALFLGPLSLRKTTWFVGYLILLGIPLVGLWIAAILDTGDCRAGCAIGFMLLALITGNFVAGLLTRILVYADFKYALVTFAGTISILITLLLCSIFYSGPEIIAAIGMACVCSVIALLTCIAKLALKRFALNS